MECFSSTLNNGNNKITLFKVQVFCVLSITQVTMNDSLQNYGFSHLQKSFKEK